MAGSTISHGGLDLSHGSPKKPSTGYDINSMRSYVLGMMSSLFNRVSLDTLRPLPMFLGISGQNFCVSPDAFTPPSKRFDKSTPEKFKSRISLNFAFFLSNYALVAAGVAVVVALMNPGMLISVAVCWALWGMHNYLISNELVLFGQNIGTLVSISHRSNALIVITTFVVIWKCLVPTITFLAISGIIIFSHSIMRDPKNIETSLDVHAAGEDDGSSSESEVLVESPVVRGDVL